MSFRLLQTGNSLPYSFPVHPASTFEAGMVAQMTLSGNMPCATVSNGFAPIGLIDDVRSTAFFAVAIDEEIIVPATGVLNGDGKFVSVVEIKAELANAHITPDSFVSTPVSVGLIPRNGVLIFPVGTELNYDLLGTGSANSIRTFVRYSYQIPGITGDDSTSGSQRMTVWFQRGIYSTTSYDPSCPMKLNGNLFVGSDGKLTTKQANEAMPSVGLVLSPPSSANVWMDFIWL